MPVRVHWNTTSLQNGSGDDDFALDGEKKGDTALSTTIGTHDDSRKKPQPKPNIGSSGMSSGKKKSLMNRMNDSASGNQRLHATVQRGEVGGGEDIGGGNSDVRAAVRGVSPTSSLSTTRTLHHSAFSNVTLHVDTEVKIPRMETKEKRSHHKKKVVEESGTFSLPGSDLDEVDTAHHQQPPQSNSNQSKQQLLQSSHQQQQLEQPESPTILAHRPTTSFLDEIDYLLSDHQNSFHPNTSDSTATTTAASPIATVKASLGKKRVRDRRKEKKPDVVVGGQFSLPGSELDDDDHGGEVPPQRPTVPPSPGVPSIRNSSQYNPQPNTTTTTTTTPASTTIPVSSSDTRMDITTTVPTHTATSSKPGSAASFTSTTRQPELAVPQPSSTSEVHYQQTILEKQLSPSPVVQQQHRVPTIRGDSSAAASPPTFLPPPPLRTSAIIEQKDDYRGGRGSLEVRQHSQYKPSSQQSPRHSEEVMPVAVAAAQFTPQQPSTWSWETALLASSSASPLSQNNNNRNSSKGGGRLSSSSLTKGDSGSSINRYQPTTKNARNIATMIQREFSLPPSGESDEDGGGRDTLAMYAAGFSKLPISLSQENNNNNNRRAARKAKKSADMVAAVKPVVVSPVVVNEATPSVITRPPVTSIIIPPTNTLAKQNDDDDATDDIVNFYGSPPVHVPSNTTSDTKKLSKRKDRCSSSEMVHTAGITPPGSPPPDDSPVTESKRDKKSKKKSRNEKRDRKKYGHYTKMEDGHHPILHFADITPTRQQKHLAEEDDKSSVHDDFAFDPLTPVGKAQPITNTATRSSWSMEPDDDDEATNDKVQNKPVTTFLTPVQYQPLATNAALEASSARRVGILLRTVTPSSSQHSSTSQHHPSTSQPMVSITPPPSQGSGGGSEGVFSPKVASKKTSASTAAAAPSTVCRPFDDEEILLSTLQSAMNEYEDDVVPPTGTTSAFCEEPVDVVESGEAPDLHVAATMHEDEADDTQSAHEVSTVGNIERSMVVQQDKCVRGDQHDPEDIESKSIVELLLQSHTMSNDSSSADIKFDDDDKHVAGERLREEDGLHEEDNGNQYIASANTKSPTCDTVAGGDSVIGCGVDTPSSFVVGQQLPDQGSALAEEEEGTYASKGPEAHLSEGTQRVDEEMEASTFNGIDHATVEGAGERDTHNNDATEPTSTTIAGNHEYDEAAVLLSEPTTIHQGGQGDAEVSDGDDDDAPLLSISPSHHKAEHSSVYDSTGKEDSNMSDLLQDEDTDDLLLGLTTRHLSPIVRTAAPTVVTPTSSTQPRLTPSRAPATTTTTTPVSSSQPSKNTTPKQRYERYHYNPPCGCLRCIPFFNVVSENFLIYENREQAIERFSRNRGGGGSGSSRCQSEEGDMGSRSQSSIGDDCLELVDGPTSSGNTSNKMRAHGSIAIVQTSAVKTSTKCPLSFTSYGLPARTSGCRHESAFDLYDFVHMQLHMYDDEAFQLILELVDKRVVNSRREAIRVAIEEDDLSVLKWRCPQCAFDQQITSLFDNKLVVDGAILEHLHEMKIKRNDSPVDIVFSREERKWDTAARNNQFSGGTPHNTSISQQSHNTTGGVGSSSQQQQSSSSRRRNITIVECLDSSSDDDTSEVVAEISGTGAERQQPSGIAGTGRNQLGTSASTLSEQPSVNPPPPPPRQQNVSLAAQIVASVRSGFGHTQQVSDVRKYNNVPLRSSTYRTEQTSYTSEWERQQAATSRPPQASPSYSWYRQEPRPVIPGMPLMGLGSSRNSVGGGSMQKSSASFSSAQHLPQHRPPQLQQQQQRHTALRIRPQGEGGAQQRTTTHNIGAQQQSNTSSSDHQPAHLTNEVRSRRFYREQEQQTAAMTNPESTTRSGVGTTTASATITGTTTTPTTTTTPGASGGVQSAAGRADQNNTGSADDDDDVLLFQ